MTQKLIPVIPSRSSTTLSLLKGSSLKISMTDTPLLESRRDIVKESEKKS